MSRIINFWIQFVMNLILLGIKIINYVYNIFILKPFTKWHPSINNLSFFHEYFLVISMAFESKPSVGQIIEID